MRGKQLDVCRAVLNLRGGTNADMAPQIDEFTEVFFQNLKHFGPNVEFEENTITVFKCKILTQYLPTLATQCFEGTYLSNIFF